jgi:hypothetical protein
MRERVSYTADQETHVAIQILRVWLLRFLCFSRGVFNSHSEFGQSLSVPLLCGFTDPVNFGIFISRFLELAELRLNSKERFKAETRQGCIVQVRIHNTLMLNIVSGEPPKHPVFSKTTGTYNSLLLFEKGVNQFCLGNVFEKHLLEAYLTENQTDPITNEPSTAEDYVELKGHCNPFTSSRSR